MSLYNLIADYRTNLSHFNRNEYKDCFMEYKAQVEATLEKIDDLGVESSAALDGLEADWASKKRKSQMRRMHDDDKMFICCFLNPALECIDTDKSKQLESTLKEKWDAKFPGDSYELGSFESIIEGFALKLFGFKISK